MAKEDGLFKGRTLQGYYGRAAHTGYHKHTVKLRRKRKGK